MIVDVGLVHMGADDKGMISLGEPPRQLIAQAVGLLRGDLAGDKGLPDLIGNHIVRPAPPAGPGEVLPFGEKELRIGDPAVTLVAGDQLAVIGFLWILRIINDVADGLPHSPALANVQGNEAGGGDR
mgnify:CR=1 FL=1